MIEFDEDTDYVDRITGKIKKIPEATEQQKEMLKILKKTKMKPKDYGDNTCQELVEENKRLRKALEEAQRINKLISGEIVKWIDHVLKE